MRNLSPITPFLLGIAGIICAYSKTNAQTFDGTWSGSGHCQLSVAIYRVSLAMQNGSVTGTAMPCGGKSDQLLFFQGQIEATSGTLALTESSDRKNILSGRATGPKLTFSGSINTRTCEFSLAQVTATPSVAAAPAPAQTAPSPAPAPAPSTSVPPPAIPAPTSPMPSPEAKVVKPIPNPDRDAFAARSGPEMANVQRSLAALGFYKGNANGLYGAGTADGISTWQRSQGLPATGYLSADEIVRVRSQALALLSPSSQMPSTAPQLSPKGSGEAGSPQTAEQFATRPPLAQQQAVPTQSAEVKPTTPTTATPASADQLEWTKILGTWVPQKSFKPERCTGNSPLPPSDDYIELKQSSIALYEGGCDITSIAKISGTQLRLSMRCGEFNARSHPKTQTFTWSNGALSVDETAYTRCSQLGAVSAPSTSPSEPSSPSVAPKETDQKAFLYTLNRNAFPVGTAIQVFYDQPAEIVTAIFTPHPKPLDPKEIDQLPPFMRPMQQKAHEEAERDLPREAIQIATQNHTLVIDCRWRAIQVDGIAFHRYWVSPTFGAEVFWVGRAKDAHLYGDRLMDGICGPPPPRPPPINDPTAESPLLSIPHGDFPSGNCHGWNGTITQRSGVNTPSAAIRGVVTESDLFEVAARNPLIQTIKHGGKLTAVQYFETLRQEAGTPLVATANCSNGEIKFQYASKSPKRAKLPLSPDATSCASGMATLVDQFRLLCALTAQ